MSVEFNATFETSEDLTAEFKDVVLTPPTLQTKSVTYTQNGTAAVEADDGYDGLEKVNITTNVPNPSTGTLYITEDGTYDVTTYASANVNTSKWTCPSWLPNLDDLNLPEDPAVFKGVYMVVGKGTLYLSPWTAASAGTFVLDLGHIENGNYVVDDTLPFSSNQTYLPFEIPSLCVARFRHEDFVTAANFYWRKSDSTSPLYESYLYYVTGREDSTPGFYADELLAYKVVKESVHAPYGGYGWERLRKLVIKPGISTTYSNQFARLYAIEEFYCPVYGLNGINNFMMAAQLESFSLNNSSLSGTVFPDSGYRPFSECYRLKELDLRGLDFSNVTHSDFFYKDHALETFYPPDNICCSMDFSTCYSLSHDSLIRIIEKLLTVTTAQTLTLGRANKSKLTDAEKQVATDKGWTIA